MKHFFISLFALAMVTFAPMAAMSQSLPFVQMAGSNDTMVPLYCSVYPTAQNTQNAVLHTDFVTGSQIVLVGASVSGFPDCYDLSYSFGGNEAMFGSNDDDNDSSTPE